MEEFKTSKEFLLSSQVQRNLLTRCRWWSKYIFHFSHVTNVAAILNDGVLKSRNQVLEIGNEELNDNASNDVIEGTEGEYKDYVRFYFRPLTPTQFHNEGIRADEEITHLGAHCPVPVFLLFDTELLDEPDVYFSYESLASHYSVPLYQGLESLKKAPFNYIYHNQSTQDLNGNTIRKHRHAEVVVKDQCNLRYLKKIVCRTKAEADTLKYMLDISAYEKYSNKIYVIGDSAFDTQNYDTVFHGNYLKLTSVSLNKKKLNLTFNKTDRYNRKVEIFWYDTRGRCITSFERESFNLGEYGKAISFTFGDLLEKHNHVLIEIILNEQLVYRNGFNL